MILRSPPAALMSLLSTQEDLLENILGCIPVGQIVTIKPLSEDFCYVLGYLLTWKLILTFFKAASSQVNKMRQKKTSVKKVFLSYYLKPFLPLLLEKNEDMPHILVCSYLAHYRHSAKFISVFTLSPSHSFMLGSVFF